MSQSNFLSDVSFRVSCRSFDLDVPGTAGISKSVEVLSVLLLLVDAKLVKAAYCSACLVLRWFFKDVVAVNKKKTKINYKFI